MISAEGVVKVTNLSTMFSTSAVTIRNDLAELEKQGLLERIRGGAVGTYKSYLALSFSDRLNVNLSDKERIAAKFSDLVMPGDTMIFNTGSTSLVCARKCFAKPGISIVTNSIIIAGEARMNKVERVVLLGGMLDGDYQFTYGDDTINHINKYMADKLIMSIDGISAGGVTTHHHSEVETTKAMMARVVPKGLVKEAKSRKVSVVIDWPTKISAWPKALWMASLPLRETAMTAPGKIADFIASRISFSVSFINRL